MSSGEIYHYREGSFVAGSVPGRGAKAFMGEFLVAIDAGVIEAAGGPCPIIVLYEKESRTGCIIHIDGGDAEQGRTEHETLIAALRRNLPNTNWSAPVLLCYDPSPTEGLPGRTTEEAEDQIRRRTQYIDELLSCLSKCGFSDIQQVTDGRGKLVAFDTSDGTVLVTDDADNVVGGHLYH